MVKCPKCQGKMIYDPPRHEGDVGSAKCLICGNRIWEPAKIVMPIVPDPGPGAKKMPPTERLEEAARINEMSKLRKRLLKLQKEEQQYGKSA